MSAPGGRPHPPLLRGLVALPRAVRVLDVGFLINGFGTFLPVFIVLYLTRAGYPPLQAALGLSAYGGGALLGPALGGLLADRVGRRDTIVGAMALAAVAVVAIPAAHALPPIALLTALSGLGSGAAEPAGAALISDVVPEGERQLAFASARLAANLGYAAGPVAAAFLIGHAPALLFVGDALTSLAFGAIALRLLPRDTPATRPSPQGGGTLRAMRHDRAFVLTLAALLAIYTVYWQQIATLPLVVAGRGLPATAYGLLISINGVVVILCEVPLTALTRRVRPQRAIAVGFLLIGAGFALLSVAGSLPALAACVLLWTVGEITWDSVASAYVAALAPPHLRGRYQGAAGAILAAGYVIAPALGAPLYAWHPVGLWLACGGLGILATSLIMLSARTRQADAS